MKIHFPSERTRRASASRTAASPGASRRSTTTTKAAPIPSCAIAVPHAEPGDPPVEAVDEQQLENEVRDVPGDEDDERRPQVGDTAQVALRAEREERGREADRGDAQVRRPRSRPSGPRRP